MYFKLGRFWNVVVRSISYMDDVEVDRRIGYRLGFDVEIVPGIRVSSHALRTSVLFRWLKWEIVFFKYHRK